MPTETMEDPRVSESESRGSEGRLEAKKEDKWTARAKKLRQFNPTGDIVHDAKSFFEADEFGADSLSATYRRAYEDGDGKTLAEYFLALWTIQAAPEGNDPVNIYYRTKKETVKKILDAYESRRTQVH